MAGGRKSKAVRQAPLVKTLVLDNGASTIKAGLVTGVDIPEEYPRVIPNCIARDGRKKLYIASELEKCRDFGEISFRRPVEKGFVVNWEVEKEIWEREFFDAKTATVACDPSESRVILTEPPNGLPALQTNCDQIVFEEYGFQSYYRCIGELVREMSCRKHQTDQCPSAVHERVPGPASTVSNTKRRTDRSECPGRNHDGN